MALYGRDMSLNLLESMDYMVIPPMTCELALKTLMYMCIKCDITFSIIRQFREMKDVH
jgi:hypothetical protein